MTPKHRQAIPIMNQAFSEPNSTVLRIHCILIKMDAWRSQTTLCPRTTSQVAQNVFWENETTTHLNVFRISDGIQINRDLKQHIYGTSRQSDSITNNMSARNSSNTISNKHTMCTYPLCTAVHPE